MDNSIAIQKRAAITYHLHYPSFHGMLLDVTTTNIKICKASQRKAMGQPARF